MLDEDLNWRCSSALKSKSPVHTVRFSAVVDKSFFVTKTVETGHVAASFPLLFQHIQGLVGTQENHIGYSFQNTQMHILYI